MDPYPLLFEPLLKAKVWGGRTLERLGKRLPPGEPIGESWELADLPDSIPGGRSVIANGPLRGQTLRAALADHRPVLLGHSRLSPDGGFPLLIKYLDARQNLSVQVHPDVKFAAKHPEAHLKSEAWVVIESDPGAVIYKGVKSHVGPSEFADHIRANTVVDDLVAVSVKPGDCHYLPSGTCHALGAGILVAEVQTPSDTTFRVYDWGRTGVGRELHIEQAMECIQFGESAAILPTRQRSTQAPGLLVTQMTATEYFEIDRVDSTAPEPWPIETQGLPEVWMMVCGRATVATANGESVTLPLGATGLMPAGLEGATASLPPGSWMLRVRLPN